MSRVVLFGKERLKTEMWRGEWWQSGMKPESITRGYLTNTHNIRQAEGGCKSWKRVCVIVAIVDKIYYIL